MNTPNLFQKPLALAAAALLLAAGGATTLLVHAQDAKAPAAAAPRPALTVTVTAPQRATVATAVAANGNVAAWQEAIVGAEANGMRLAEVLVNVGDVVRKGQVLARFDSAMASADLAQSRAAVAEAEANLAEAAANAQRARDLQGSGALSAQQVAQLLTAERTAQARLEAVKAAQQVQQLRLQQAQVLAPDSGVISARSATVGAVVPAGTELFRLVRQGRLEWRGEVAATELAQIQRGQKVTLAAAGAGVPVTGTVRQVAPTVDAATRNALVYVDLPDTGGRLKAGMFARGEFATGSSTALTLPQSAVLLRDGFSYVFAVGADNRAAQLKVSTGRRSGERIEILAGLDEKARVVTSGGGFLADGDTVRVVAAPPATPAAAVKTTASK
ncbi:MAG: efflux RND transporter periplasmic adaptor subunit [Betaproteobacteria bacterium]|jgi:HlyD family secretion protein|nr:efflux RND transporter periplasmic adaptor subunit [Burkholderiaceae bacterium]MCZ8110825.1 efflux RND transporter periplasmic adaptor subunit [Rubrivivax sp.]MCZ8174177.1 efflux RND transporter periplasmic adaptor subunit [Burkholderiaceae bacterium]